MASIIRIICYDEEAAINGPPDRDTVVVNIPLDMEIRRPFYKVIMEGIENIATSLWLFQNE